MKRFKFLILCSLAVVSASAQSKLDASASEIVNTVRDMTLMSRSGIEAVRTVGDYSPDSKYAVLISFDSDDALDGLDVIARRDDMAIVRLTASEMEAVAALPSIRKLSLGTEATPCMNTARVVAGVDAARAGTELGGTKYTGAGVIAGMMDSGVDINHINFLDADGEPRATSVWTVKGASGTITKYQTPEKIKSFSTDNRESSHGTHVLGIMAGSYNGPADYAFYNSRGRVQIKKQDAPNSAIPFYGVAKDAEIAAACGDFTNSNVEIGAELVANYAKEQGKPCVVNLSIGNTLGPHDGTDDNCRWLDRIGEDAIVCVAAGNDGEVPISLSKTFKSGDLSLRTITAASANAEGSVDIWGADNNVFGVTFGILDTNTGNITFSYGFNENLKGESVYITGSYYTASGYIHDSNFDTAFGTRGAVIVTSNVDAANNRYSVRLNLQLGGSGNRYLPVITVTGKAGQHVDCYSNGDALFASRGLDGYTDGDASGSINGLACGYKTISVGSYDNVASWVILSGSQYTYNPSPVPGAISSFSSYGTTFDGRQLPEVCGPGGAVISSYSKYYVEGEDVDQTKICGRYNGKSRNSYWDVMSGTSMATPFVSGVIALWLQADPTLTVADVKRVIAETSTNDAQTAVEAHRWGSGKINALAGLKNILNLSGISDVRNDEADVFISSADNRNYDIEAIGAVKLSAEVYSLAGVKVAAVSAEGQNATLSLDGVEPGVYVLRVATDKSAETHKIAVK